MPESDPKVLTPEEVAELLRVDVRTVYRRAKKGEIPGSFRVGRLLRFQRTAIEALVGDTLDNSQDD